MYIFDPDSIVYRDMVVPLNITILYSLRLIGIYDNPMQVHLVTCSPMNFTDGLLGKKKPFYFSRCIS